MKAKQTLPKEGIGIETAFGDAPDYLKAWNDGFSSLLPGLAEGPLGAVCIWLALLLFIIQRQ